MKRGIFISLEGGDGCGKSTQITRLTQRLEAAGREVFRTREPGGTPLGESIRTLLQSAREGYGMAPETELLLFAASRAELVRKVIAPKLEAGVIVLADRFLDSTTVYQGYARGLDLQAVAAIQRFVLGPLLPDLTLFFDLPPPLARRRLQARLAPEAAAPDRMEALPEAFHQAVYDGYRELARQEPQRIRTLDASGTPEEVEQALLNLLTQTFHGLFTGSRP